MKKKIIVIIYLLACSAIISAGIYARENYHDNCRECKFVAGKHLVEHNMFAGVCK